MTDDGTLIRCINAGWSIHVFEYHEGRTTREDYTMQVVTEASPYRPPPPLDKQRDEADLKAVLTGVLYTLLAVGIIALVVLTTFAAMATGAGDSRSDEADDFELIGDTDYGRPGGASGGGGGAGGSRGWLVITRRPAVPPRRPPAPIHPEDPPTCT
ncbi:uncharacterized protein LOC144134491 [Amblyomma americanum]